MVRFLATVLLSNAAFSQVAPTPKFDVADVRVSQRSDWAKKPGTAMQGGFLNAGRYELRRATMLDLIRTAYAVDADKIYGGPSWLDYDRFEVVAKAPPATRPEVLRLMLQSLLADRFNLVVKMDSRPVPSYLLSMGKGQPKLKPAEANASSGCQSLPPTMKDVPYGNIQCRNVTMQAFAPALRRFASAAFDNLPVVDSTGLEGSWDIDLQYAMQVVSIGPNMNTVTASSGGIIEAIDKQLGLTLERKTAPQPVLVVESVNEQPSANPPGVSTSLPPLPSPEFEVASIRPCNENMSISPRFQTGGRLTATCMPLMTLISRAWNLAPFQPLIGAPKWLTANNSPSLTIVAKAPAGSFMDTQGAQDQDAISAMMRALLVDRFKMEIHFEDRPVDAYTLLAVKPKLTKADPANLTGCTRQNPPGSTGGLALRLVCQNITLAQFAEQMQGFDSNIFYPVLDGTALDGAWDFTLNYNILLNVPGLVARGGAAPGEASDPTGGISFIDAVEKQLGLKVEMQKRLERVLILDHIEEKPTEN